MTPDRDGFIVTFAIDEGERYRFGKIDVDVKLKDLNRDDVMPLLTVQPGDWYDADAVEHAISVLTDAMGNRGYAFVEVKPEIKRNRDDRTVDVTFDVQEGPQVYVERIDITGNVRTLDKVIRREMRLVEGDAFNTDKMKRSKERIKNLGFFKKVEVNNKPGSAPDRTVVAVEVEEQSTGELSFGLGFSSSDGPLIDASIGEKNFLGRGDDVRIGSTLNTFVPVAASRSELHRPLFPRQEPGRRRAGICSRSRPARPAISSPASRLPTSSSRMAGRCAWATRSLKTCARP